MLTVTLVVKSKQNYIDGSYTVNTCILYVYIKTLVSSMNHVFPVVVSFLCASEAVKGALKRRLWPSGRELATPTP